MPMQALTHTNAPKTATREFANFVLARCLCVVAVVTTLFVLNIN